MQRMSIIVFVSLALMLIPMLVDLHAQDSGDGASDVTAESRASSSCGSVFLASTKTEGEGGEDGSSDTEDLTDESNKPKIQNFTGFVTLTGGEGGGEGEKAQEPKDGYCEYAGDELVCYVDNVEYRNCKPLEDGNVECANN